MIQKSLSYILIAMLFWSCEGPVGKGGDKPTISDSKDTLQFPPLASLDTMLTTEFVPTLQHIYLQTKKNIVYTPTFLYAWDELRQYGHGELKVPANNEYMGLINNSRSFKDALSANEYSTDLTKEGYTLTIKAYFKKGLPFKEEMDTAIDKFTFNGTKVKAFGMPYYSEKVANQINILYYASDEKFIIKIIPKDEQEEIILAKGFDRHKKFEEVLESLNNTIELGTKEKKLNQNKWKYILGDEDEVLIPVVTFNYIADYTHLLGDTLSLGREYSTIDRAIQRNAFLIDEHGAKVESEATIVTTTTEAPPPQNAIKHVKKLWLNKDFILVLKKEKSKYPYLMMAVRNAEIMVRR